jgi:hypothetical protein
MNRLLKFSLPMAAFAAAVVYLVSLSGGALASPVGQTGPSPVPTHQPAPPPPPPAAPTPVPPGFVEVVCPTATGCVVDGFLEGVRIVFPPGVLPRDARVQYRVMGSGGACGPLPGARLYFDLTVVDNAGNQITQLNGQISITANNATGIGVCEPPRWVDITTQSGGGTATGRVNHVTLFAVSNQPAAAPPAAPAAAPPAAPAAAPPAAAPAAAPPAVAPPAAGGAAPAAAAARPPAAAPAAALPRTGGPNVLLVATPLIGAGLLAGAGLMWRRRRERR